MKEYIVPLSEDEAFYGYKGMTVELIRCKDCKHYEANKGYMWGTCGVNIHDVDETDWCSWAERRNDETD